ncbi:MAG TPA: DUF2442 domain-containing protein [Candidatus Acidoferrum sp.]|jgi:hypothetical protein|nr:DUF2442 domain-containing protein [Candidatus Acidoferrum sp.]
MSFSASAADERVLDVQSADDALSVSLQDGRVITVPLVWYPRLLNATPAQRRNWKIAGGGYGIHWPDLDEDLSTERLLRGARTETKEPKHIATESKSASVRRHWLDYIDVAARVALPLVAIWWGVKSFHTQNALTEKNLSIQIKQQNDVLLSQREIGEAQLASSLVSWFKCEDSPQRLMAQQMLGSVSPKQAFLVNQVLAKCGRNPKDRETARKYSLQDSVNELKQGFLQQLNLARQYRSAGLHRRAAKEYEGAYNELPESFRAEIDVSTAGKAREAMQQGDAMRASDLFEQLFRLIETP